MASDCVPSPEDLRHRPVGDILIVGAGPAGLSTALFLVARDPSLCGRIEVVDRAVFPREKYCAGAIGARADKLLATIGVRVDVPSMRADGLAVRFNAGIASRSVGGIGRVVRRFEFDAALLRIARDRGIRISEGVKVTGLRRHARGVSVETSAGVRDVRVVVGADGVQSVVRRALGVPPGTLRAQVIEVDTPAAKDDLPGILDFDLRDEGLLGYAWDFPTVVDGQPLMCRGVYDLGWEGTRTVELTTRLERHLAERGVSMKGLTLKRYTVRGLELQRPMAEPRVMLVGEAAGVDPLLGEGIAQSIASGALAADYLLPRLADDRLDFDDWRRTFASSATGVDLLARTAALQFLRTPLRRRVLEAVTLRAPEALDVTTSLFAGHPIPKRSALTALRRFLP